MVQPNFERIEPTVNESSKSWGTRLDDALHNPYVDTILGAAALGAVGAAVLLSRGRFAGVAESMLPEASSLLGEATQINKASAEIRPGFLMGSSLLSKTTEELALFSQV